MAARPNLRGGRQPQGDMHLGHSFRHRGEKFADLGGDIFACEIGAPIDSVLAPDVAAIDVNELHFLYSEAGAGDAKFWILALNADGRGVSLGDFGPTPSWGAAGFGLIGGRRLLSHGLPFLAPPLCPPQHRTVSAPDLSTT